VSITPIQPRAFPAIGWRYSESQPRFDVSGSSTFLILRKPLEPYRPNRHTDHTSLFFEVRVEKRKPRLTISEEALNERRPSAFSRMLTLR
jgi:hypothetical protein